MSFSYDTKNELCRLPVQKLCCARAEAYGILLFCNTFSATEVRIITENPHFAARLPKLFRRAFNLQFDRQPEQEEGKRIFQITDQKKLDHIINLLGFDPQQNLVLHINFGMVEETCDRAAFLRGAFFAGGSITDPQKRYHLELTTSHLQVSRELDSLLQECGYPPKSLSRGGSLITYFKQSDQIEDFLTLIGAPVADGGSGDTGCGGGHPPPASGGAAGAAAGQASGNSGAAAGIPGAESVRDGGGV